MQGSLQSPPIIVQSSRGKVTWQLFVLVCVGALGLFNWVSSGTPTFSAVALTIVGVGGSLMAARSLIRPDSLVLSPEGLVWTSALRTRRFAWRDIDNFHVQTHVPGPTQWKTVMFDSDPDDPGKIRPVDLGKAWETGNQSLADLLNSARSKWLRAGTD